MARCDTKPSQNQRILQYMGTFGGITSLEAMRDLGVQRLASRISDLRRLGWPITSEFITVENRFGEKCNVKRYMLVDCKYRKE